MEPQIGFRSLKKRHTKPCKYFKVGTCPYSAEECDFCHDQLATPCRYFDAGYCKDGMLCRFKHEIRQQDCVWYEGPPLDTFSGLHVSTQYSNHYAEMARSPVYVSSPSIPFQIPWMSTGDTRLFGDSSKPPPMPHILSPIDSLDSSTSRTSSPSSSVYGDCADTPQNSPHYVDPKQHVRNGQILPPSLGRLATIPHLLRHTNNAFHNRNARNKAACYKTKHCKFYNKELGRACPSGDECTFIHEHPDENPATRPDPSILPRRSRPEHKRPPPVPATWRVIGGGVLIGDPSNESEDAEDLMPEGTPLPGAKTSRTDVAELILEPRSAGHHVRSTSELGCNRKPLRKEPSVPPPKLEMPVNLSLDIYDATRSSPKRSRSSSIPSTPSISQYHPNGLFSAESPGVL